MHPENPRSRLRKEAVEPAHADLAALPARQPDPFRPEYAFLREVAYVSGALLMIEAALFRSLDGFDDLFAPAYFEDTDLCVRARPAGG